MIQLQLSVANEQSDVGTTQVQLFFPEGVPITLVDLPGRRGLDDSHRGWCRRGARHERDVVAADGDSRREPPAPADDRTAPGRSGAAARFKALQTYTNGEVERWIDDWPAGAPEPEHPAPVLEVTADGPGVAPAPGTTAGGSTSTSAATTTPTTDAATAPTLIAPNPDESDDDDSSNVGLIVGVIAAVVVVAGIVGFLLWRRSQHPGAPPAPPAEAPGDDSPPEPRA